MDDQIDDIVEIIHNGIMYKIEREYFMVSTKFIKDYINEKKVIINDKYSKTSFQSFIDYLHDYSRVPCIQVYEDVVSLLKIWGCRVLINSLLKESPKYENDTIIIHNDIIYHVSWKTMVFKCKYFENYCKSNHNEVMCIRDNFNDDSFALFLDVVHEKIRSIPQNELLNIYQISVSLKCDWVIQNIMPKSTEFCLLCAEIEPNDTYESILAEDIRWLMSNERFSSLPISLLIRIIQKSSIPVDLELMNTFINNAYQKHGVSSMSLIPFIQIEQGIENISLLNSLCSIGSNNVFSCFIEGINKEKEQKKEMQNEIDKLKDDILNNAKNFESATQELISLKSSIESLKEEMNNIINEKNEEIKKMIEKYESPKTYKTLNYQSPQSLNGIIDHLKAQPGAITITTASGYDGTVILKGTNYDDNGHNTNNLWICFDFSSNYTIKLSSYSIVSYPAVDDYHPRSWTISGSNDNNLWTILDTKTDSSALKGNAINMNFPCNSGESFRYIRYLNNGINWHSSGSNYCIVFSKIEFFGEINLKK